MLRRLFARHPAPLPATPHFVWALTVLCFSFVVGIYTDGWAHNHLASELETFFTPWHAMLYGGFGLIGIFALWYAWTHRRAGEGLASGMPAGYDLVLCGAGVFALGGAGDMAWHLTFGIEEGIEALLSPTHLALAVGALLMVSGPFRAWLTDPDAPTPARLRDFLPVVLSMAMTLAVVTFMTQFAHFIRAYEGGMAPLDPDLSQGRAVAAHIMQTGFWLGTLFLALRRSRVLPFGTVTLLLGSTTFAMSYMSERHELTWAALAAGLAIDVMARSLHDGTINVFRRFAFTAPAIFTAFYLLAIALTDGIWWSVHMWAGAIVITGLTGLLLSFVLIAPQPSRAR